VKNEASGSSCRRFSTWTSSFELLKQRGEPYRTMFGRTMPGPSNQRILGLQWGDFISRSSHFLVPESLVCGRETCGRLSIRRRCTARCSSCGGAELQWPRYGLPSDEDWLLPIRHQGGRTPGEIGQKSQIKRAAKLAAWGGYRMAHFPPQLRSWPRGIRVLQ